MSTPTVDEFRAKVIVIAAQSMSEVLSLGFIIRRVTEEYAKAIEALVEESTERGRLIALLAQDWAHMCCDHPADCACTMGQAVRLARKHGTNL